MKTPGSNFSTLLNCFKPTRLLQAIERQPGDRYFPPPPNSTPSRCWCVKFDSNANAWMSWSKPARGRRKTKHTTTATNKTTPMSIGPPRLQRQRRDKRKFTMRNPIKMALPPAMSSLVRWVFSWELSVLGEASFGVLSLFYWMTFNISVLLCECVAPFVTIAPNPSETSLDCFDWLNVEKWY